MKLLEGYMPKDAKDLEPGVMLGSYPDFRSKVNEHNNLVWKEAVARETARLGLRTQGPRTLEVPDYLDLHGSFSNTV